MNEVRAGGGRGVGEGAGGPWRQAVGDGLMTKEEGWKVQGCSLGVEVKAVLLVFKRTASAPKAKLVQESKTTKWGRGLHGWGTGVSF